MLFNPAAIVGHADQQHQRGRDGMLRVVGYAPIKPRRKAVPPPLFRGTVHWGDN